MDEEDLEAQQLLRRLTAGRRPPGNRSNRITAGTLRDLLKDDPAIILLALNRQNSGFVDLLKRTDLSVDTIRLIVAVLGKVFQCESLSEDLNTLVSDISVTSFLDHTLLQFLTQIGSSKNGDDEVVRNCLPFLTELLRRMPTEGCNKVQTLSVVLQVLWQKGGAANEDINKGMTDLIDLLHRSQPPPPREGPPEGRQETNNQEPPENFRELPIIPRHEELDGTVDVFLLHNKIEGGFRDLAHYLECQFRLFRADVIMPLKESIVDYQTVGKDTSVGYRIYTNVSLVRPVCSHNGLGYRIAFETGPLRHVKWQSSRRLIFGSLLCLSSDNFKEQMLFATVDQRDSDLLKKGLVDVKFLTEPGRIANIQRDTRFAMVESQAYFESYKYILEGMQRLTERNVPFQKYLVECQSDVGLPRYLRQRDDFLYDLRPLLDDGFKIGDSEDQDTNYPAGSEIANNIKVQDSTSWPIPDILRLDHSQLIALKNALTKEFALIQGPPGTGKTYVGVKILKTLLHNSQVWNQGQRLPILVVCYTNHALDQFLEATLQFFEGSLIRVGSRSKSERMQAHSLKDARQRARELRSLPAQVHASKLETIRAMEELKAEIHTTAAKLEVAEREIIHERCLKEFMSEKHKAQFPNSEFYSCHIVDWLHVKEQLHQIEQEGEYLQHELEQVGYDQDEDDGYQDEETIDLATNLLSHRQLDDDLFDEEQFDDLRERGRSLDATIQKVRKEAMGLDISNLDVSNESSFLPKALKAIHQEKQRKKTKLKFQLISKIRSLDRMTAVEAERVFNLWKLPYFQRWRLYRYWVDQLCRQLKGEIRDKEREYERLSRRHRDVLMQEDREILQNCSIIGMTTTGAARYQQILNEIGPKIIVVEEAAEVLEAHIIGTLSRECQHLILIGDHKQLRPNPTVHKLAKNYGLEVSLFERMVRNDLKCDTLLWQHRMRPEIADVIRKVYKNLKDHDVVTRYENVKGISKNLYFIDHSHPHNKDEETKSFSNEHEAKFMIALCKYLLKQGYSTDRITILTTYSAQMHFLKDHMPKSQFDGIRVVAVDSYQGEENDIVLLSLVRSGEESNIGFLAEDNRICVALSRARIGLYVIGNFKYITDHSPLMKDICTEAGRKGLLGTKLPLSCPNHPNDKGISAENPRDFERVPEGGCTKPCEYRLLCGHTCPKMCHANDLEHKAVICSKPCKRRCSDCQQVTCTNPCYMPCSPCPNLREECLPKCGHTQNIGCKEDTTFVRCQMRCEEILPCSHRCGGLCGQPHPKCTEPVEVTRPCGHTIMAECGNKDSSPCTKPCEKILSCDHPCQGSCGSCFQGRLHYPCRNPCDRVLICGHICQSSCSSCPPCTRPCENRCNHSQCGKKCGEPCVSCKEECQWKCRHFKCTTTCGDQCNRQKCNDKCRKKLECGHGCIGVCGEPCPTLCRTCNKDEVVEVFFGNEDEPNARFIELEDCKHIFEMTGMDEYMNSTEDGEDKVVKIKVCPKCQTPIRRNLRYGNIIKEALLDIEKAKEKVRGNEEKIRQMKTSMRKGINRLPPADSEALNQLLDSVTVASENILVAQKNQISIFKQLVSIERTIKESKSKFRADNEIYEKITRNIQDFKKWILLKRSCFSKQEVEDATKEIERVTLLKYLIDAREWIEQDRHEVPARIMRNLIAIIRRLESPSVMTEDELKDAQQMKEDVKDYVPGSGLGISDEERLMIVEAIGLSKGHWYKCKRGHVYAIGECGRALEESTCPECGGAVGGQSHQLVEGNDWAPEMDDAEEPVWSEERDYLLALQLQFGDRR